MESKEKSTSWDYSKLASTYENRPEYSTDAINWLLKLSNIKKGDKCCDIGAGTGRLTKWLLAAGLEVDAIEPNFSMREIGKTLTQGKGSVRWIEATAEDNKLHSNYYSLVTFGSSFNVTDRTKALKETSRILKPNGWFSCLWNHRDLCDPIQTEIEELIKRECPAFSYGSRREDQTKTIQESGLFVSVCYFEAGVVHKVNSEDWINAWYSHATLARYAGERLKDIVNSIGEIVRAKSPGVMTVPYITRIWAAQAKN